MTPAQCRAARAYLNVTVDELAARAGCSGFTIIRFENGRPELRAVSLMSIEAALTACGIRFLPDGVRLLGPEPNPARTRVRPSRRSLAATDQQNAREIEPDAGDHADKA